MVIMDIVRSNGERCNVCDEDFKKVLWIHDEWHSVSLCEDCIKKALEMIMEG